MNGGSKCMNIELTVIINELGFDVFTTRSGEVEMSDVASLAI